MKFNNKILKEKGFLGEDLLPDITTLKKCRNNIRDEIEELEKLFLFLEEEKEELKESILKIIQHSFSMDDERWIEIYAKKKLEKLKMYHSTIENIIKQSNSDTNKNIKLLYKIVEETKEEKKEKEEKNAKYFTYTQYESK